MTAPERTTLEAVRSRLERVTGPDRAGWYTARCPFHDDRHPSLRFTDAGFKCMACGEHGSLADLVRRLAGASAGPVPSTAQGIATTYDYADEGGALLFQGVRKRPKGFFQRRPDGQGGWINDLKGVRFVPYRLPEVLSADPGAALFVVEGEKDADRLWAEGIPSTTNSMGAGKWRPEYNEHLRGRHIAILPDNDDAGRKHAAVVARSLHGVAADVRIVELPGLPEKGDISDWLDAGGTAAELLALAADCAEWAPEETTAPDEPKGECARSDAGNGELFAQLYGDRVRYDHRRNRWLVWSGHHWTDDADGEVRRLAKLAVRHRQLGTHAIDDLAQRASAARFAINSESRQRLEALLAQAQSEPPVSDAGTQWDSDAWSLGVANGVVDLRSGQLRAGQPDDRITMHVPIAYEPNAACPRWLQFLDEVFSGNAELIDFIQRAAGYSLTAMTTEQCLFLCYGTGSNGKSVFLNVLREVAGQYGHNASFSLFELRSRSAIPNDVAALYNRRLVTSSETNEGTRLNEARVKALTGGDRLSARFLHAEFFEFDPTGKYWLAVNHKPNVQDDSHGFWRRVRLIPFTRQFSGAGADSQLLLTLRNEMAGILAWAVRGAQQWHERGLAAPHAVRVATETYRIESDPLARFIDERCVADENASVLASRAYKAYRLWGLNEGMNDKELLSSTMFGTKMTARFDKKKRNDGTHYMAIGLWSERPEPESDRATFGEVEATSGEEVTGCESEYPSLSGSSLVTSSTRENIDQPVTPVTPVTFEPCRGDCGAMVPAGQKCTDCAAAAAAWRRK